MNYTKALVREVAQYNKEILQRIADEYGLWVDTMEMMKDHVPVFWEVLQDIRLLKLYRL